MQNKILIFFIYLLSLSIIYPQKGQISTGNKMANNVNFSYADTVNTNQKINNPPGVDTSESISRIHFQATIGLCEYLSYGIGYNFNKNNALLIKRHGMVLGDVAMGGAWGLKYTYSFQSKIFIKNISITASLINELSLDKTTYNRDRFVKGGAIEIATSRKKDFDSGIVFQYEIGISVSKILDREIHVLPNFKIGLNYNF